jgi:ribosome modulation factor
VNDSNRKPSSVSPSPNFARLTLLAGLVLSLMLPAALLIWTQPSTSATALEQPQGCVPTVIAYSQVNVRSGPSTQFEPPIGALFAGQTAQVTGRLSDNSWYRVIFNSREGWVFGQIVQTSCMQNVPVVPNPPLPPGPTPIPLPTSFVASPTVITPPQCSTLSWNITEVAGVWLISGGYQQGVGGVDSRTVCPTTTTVYTLLVQRRDGSTYQQSVTVNVNPPQPSDPNFRADAYSVNLGGCTTLRWNVSNVRAVFFWDGSNQQGVGGNDSRQVCPLNTSTYRLQVIGNDGVSRDYFVTVSIAGGAPAPNVNFYADNASLAQGQCTNLRWQVSGQFNAIMLMDSSTNSTTVVGPNGDIRVCPNQSATYILRVTGVDGRQYDNSVQVTVFAGPTPAP